ncbi:MAG: alpha-ribazole phosphatase, partial [Bacteroidales bacterium]|nr:alpha-ribazole phosphatase [Bacteroidales bacterium]
MRLILIRHTKTECNTGICYGQTDVLPDSTFKEESKKIINKLAKYKYDAIYTSPLKRCLMLTQSITGNQKFIVDKRLKELNFGDWEMKLWNDISKTSYAKKWFDDYMNTPCPNGESFVQLINRINSFILDIKQTQMKNILIVTHAGPVRAFCALITQWEHEELFKLDIDYGA